MLSGWALVIAVLSLIASYALSLLDHDPCQEITIAIVTGATSIVDFYLHKSYKEKDSRNKYGIDANGVPYAARVSAMTQNEKEDAVG